ncbi:MAG TPA: hypothetical protein DDW94_02860 [Deltaproteobacteria bacterium]|nr:MAG: hypothetical protein A2Z79_08985 [Deltaproteobacteria bacterium GWA2_55_82]OGQ64601.1 MAG: hypothetical protein A3I81_11250 [Deltaproteobacteria bacterium RIFCSPLOWO2_02_FULL_55_12]OIJ73699.1 MAG: hypothetical protein A2V21_305120 [Deltaproteobacteria bacterium GWC2_55_46]HBG45908.1 hypothetical protein [Deltaproteobacteria bacterium]HCY09673.1 hypothetical protein [Deltaproteobacteria bacterium]
MKKKNRILLCGYYGRGNSGDDALASVCIERLWSAFKPESISVLSGTPVWCNRNPGVFYPDLTVRFARTRAMLSSNIIVYGGGGVLQDHRGLADLKEKHRNIAAAKALGKKVLFLGISVGPLSSPQGQRLAARVLNMADYISVRDDDSFRLVTERLRVTAPVDGHFDLAVLMDRSVAGKEEKGNVLGVSLVPAKDAFGLSGEISYLENLAGVLRRVIDEYGFEIRFFVFNKMAGDEELAKRMCALIGDQSRLRIIDYDMNPVRVFEQVKACSHFMGMRLHSGIFAFMASIPFIMVNYHPKCEGFAEKIKLSRDALIDIQDPKDLERGLLGLARGTIAPSGYSLDEARREAERSFDRALSFV